MATNMLADFSGFIEPQMAAPIFEDARRSSVAQQLIPQIPLAASGAKIPHVTGRPTANWVAEGAKKPISGGDMGLINIVPHKLAGIFWMSAEVVRANPGNVTSILRTDMAEAFGRAFDYAVLHGLGGDGTGVSPFADSLADTTKSVTLGTATAANGGIHTDLVSALDVLVADGKRLTGWALDDTLEPTLLGAVDTTGRPLYVDLPSSQDPFDAPNQAVRRGRLLQRPSLMAEAVANGTTAGFAGNWSKAAWGSVQGAGGISFRVSTEASIDIGGTVRSAFQENLVLVLAEAEFGFAVHDVEHFTKLVTGP